MKVITFLEGVSSHPVAFFILFVLLFCGIVAALCRKRAISFFLGLLRCVASCFYAPVLWLKKAMVSTAEFSWQSEGDELQSDQYLLNRFLVITRGVLVVVGVAGVAAGFASSLSGVVPPKSLREELSRVRQELRAESDELRIAKDQLAEVQERWQVVGADKVRAFRSTASSRLAEARRRMEEAEKALKDERWFADIKEELAGVSLAAGPEAFDVAQAKALRRIREIWVWRENDRERARGYVHAWREWVGAEHQLRTVTEETIRQQLLAERSQEHEKARKRVEDVRKHLKDLQDIVRGQVMKALLNMAVSLLSFIALLWVVGLAVEWLWLFIHLANNVRVLRERS